MVEFFQLLLLILVVVLSLSGIRFRCSGKTPA
jgi:hypothetical protein